MDGMLVSVHSPTFGVAQYGNNKVTKRDITLFSSIDSRDGLALRGAFLMECLADLRKSLMKRELNLLIRSGKPEDILPSLAKDFGAHTAFYHKETCSEELHVERIAN
ncbi:unnamed protein product [Eruca vesicaria subsp. sativa]|uniref:Photolyase/cryptochrome alpha/beta domain-containing protein n=1 Tax=Eruca vesicaria subsp. sativa TaxID=29727 RepID=A0ABC8JV74_ERUVS|nr:unnamed protein product [Eruca vesicaria subsp. sativa]